MAESPLLVLAGERQEGYIRKTMAARGLVNGEGPTKWEGFSFPDVALLPSCQKKEDGDGHPLKKYVTKNYGCMITSM